MDFLQFEKHEFAYINDAFAHFLQNNFWRPLSRKMLIFWIVQVPKIQKHNVSICGSRKRVAVTWSGLQHISYRIYKNMQFKSGGVFPRKMLNIVSKLHFLYVAIFLGYQFFFDVCW